MLPQTLSPNITTDGGCDMPNWLIVILAILFLSIGISAVGFTWSKCGARTLILGNGGLAAAATGMCEEK